MSMPTFTQIVTIICEVREDLSPTTVTATALPVADLGLDSLDLIQIARLLRKRHQVELFIETWPWKSQPMSTITEHLHQL
ncbi:MAG: acyl carrier protein [Propionibacteriaceae bacterium]